MTNKKRLLQLDSLRFFALLLIVLSHLEFLKSTNIGDFYWKFLHNATFGVDFFFMLSGFGLYYSLNDKELRIGVKESVLFAINKIKKNYPLYIFALIISFPYNLIDVNIKYFVINLVVNISLLQSLFCSTIFSHGINGVSWFLSTLFVCYLFTIGSVVFVRKNCTTFRRTLLFLFSDIALLLFFSVVALYLEDFLAVKIVRNGETVFDDFFYGSPYTRIWYVFLGMIIANIYLRYRELNADLSLVEICIGTIVIAWFLLRNSMQCEKIVLRSIDVFSTAFLLLIYSFGKGCVSRALAKSHFLTTIGGDYGMYIYLLHYPVRMSVDIFGKKYGFFEGGYSYVIEVALIFSLTVLLCIFAKNLFERGKLKWMSR